MLPIPALLLPADTAARRRATTVDRGAQELRSSTDTRMFAGTRAGRQQRRSRFVVAFALLATVVLSLLAVGDATAAPHEAARAPVRSIDTGDVVGDSVLRRSDRAVWGRVSTEGLVPGDAYTVWAVVFNNPEACDGPCDAADLADPAVEGVSLALAGRVARSTRVTFTGRLRVGHGLTRPHQAEVHLVVRTHGPLIRELRRAQLTTLNGGCPPNTCVNVQMAVHRGA